MIHRGIFVFGVVIVLVCVSFEEVHALKCWTCSTSLPNEQYCGDPFDPSIISDQQRRLGYDDCKPPPGQLNPYSQMSVKKAVCKKLAQTVNGKFTVSRSCYWENESASKNECSNINTPSHIKTEFCEICETDGCNGAEQIFSNIVLVFLPVFIAKIILPKFQ